MSEYMIVIEYSQTQAKIIEIQLSLFQCNTLILIYLSFFACK